MSDITPDEIAAIVKRSGLSQRGFAQAIGEDEKTLRLWLKGDRRPDATQCAAFRSFDTRSVGGLLTALPNTNTALVPVVSQADKAASVELFNEQYLRLGEHLWIVGMTNSGKTHWALLLVQKYPRFVILDFNRDIDIPRVPIHATVDENAPRQIIRVVAANQKAEQAAWCDAITKALAMGDLVLFLDELAPLTTTVHAPEELYRALTYGRHRNVSLILVTHRPVAIPRIIPTQTHHHCYFQLDGEDANKVRELAGNPDIVAPDRPRFVGYYNKRTRFAGGFDLDDARRTREAEAAQRAETERQREADAQHSYKLALDKQPAPPSPDRARAVGATAGGEEYHTLTRAQIDKIRQTEHDKGLREGLKQGKEERKQITARAASTPEKRQPKPARAASGPERRRQPATNAATRGQSHAPQLREAPSVTYLELAARAVETVAKFVGRPEQKPAWTGTFPTVALPAQERHDEPLEHYDSVQGGDLYTTAPAVAPETTQKRGLRRFLRD